jgi:hypothetical protein
MSRVSRKNALILLSAAIFIFYYAFVQQTNYIGLGHTVGDRFFYAYPVFLFLIDAVRIDKKFLLVSSIIVVLGFPLVSNPIALSKNPTLYMKQLPYRILPLELPMISGLLGTVSHNSASYYFDGDFGAPSMTGSFLGGGYSGTIFVAVKGQPNNTKFLFNLTDYGCKVNIGISTNIERKVIAMDGVMKKEVEIQSNPVFYIYNENKSVYKIGFDSDNGCSQYLNTPGVGNASSVSQIKRNLSIFVSYPIMKSS